MPSSENEKGRSKATERVSGEQACKSMAISATPVSL